MRKPWHGIQVTELRSPDGATIVIADHGAHVLSWVPAGGEEALFLSEQSRFGGSDAIRGGVPIIFPQFGERGNGKRHGFARVADWRLDFAGIEQGRAVARYALTHQDVPDCGWPHQFRLAYEVTAHDRQLQMSLAVHNPSDERWEFNAALHTYLRVSDVQSVGLQGLQGTSYIDQVRSGISAVQHEETLHIVDEVDRIYPDAPKAITLLDGECVITMQQSGFPDSVVWNPGGEAGQLIVDLALGAHGSFLCVEAAAVARPIVVAPGAHWLGAQVLVVR